MPERDPSCQAWAPFSTSCQLRQANEARRGVTQLSSTHAPAAWREASCSGDLRSQSSCESPHSACAFPGSVDTELRVGSCAVPRGLRPLTRASSPDARHCSLALATITFDSVLVPAPVSFFSCIARVATDAAYLARRFARSRALCSSCALLSALPRARSRALCSSCALLS